MRHRMLFTKRPSNKKAMIPEGMSKEEWVLVRTAETHEDDEVANEAMKQLREKYGDYFFCSDCDGLVVKRENCCLNRAQPSGSEALDL